jgi:hypothetical protein
LPSSLTTARHKAPSSGSTCPLSNGPNKRPHRNKPAPTPGEGRGRRGAHFGTLPVSGQDIFISRKYTLRGPAFLKKATLFFFLFRKTNHIHLSISSALRKIV